MRSLGSSWLMSVKTASGRTDGCDPEMGETARIGGSVLINVGYRDGRGQRRAYFN